MATNIPISQIVNADVSIANAAVEQQNFNNLLLVTTQNTTPPIIPKSERVRLYTSSDAVISDFGAASQAAIASQVWFGQSPQPEELLITLRYGTGSAPTFSSSVLGLTVDFDSALAQWNAITDGALVFTYNDVIFTLSNMDFSSIVTPEDVTTIIQGILDNIQPSNLQINLKDQAGNDIDDDLWTTIVAVTGALIFNYDPTHLNFYLSATTVGVDYTDIGTPTNGTDISVAALTNLASGFISQSPIAAAWDNNTCTATIDFGTNFDGVTDGSFNMTVNTVAADYVDLDFTNATNNQDVAAIISRALTIGLGYNVNAGLTAANTLSIQSTATNMDISAVTTAGSGTDISTFAFDTVTNVEAGTYLETPPEAISAANELNTSWYGTALTKEGTGGTDVSFENIKLTASYIQSLTKQYYARLSDLAVATSSTTDEGSTLANYNFTRTVPCFNELNEYLDVAAAGNLLTTIAGSSTLMFKTGLGVSGSSVNANGQAFVLGKNVNIQSLIGGVTIIRNGTVSSTQTQFADVIRFVDWLTNEIETNVYALLVSAAKIPYTDTGVNILIGGVKLSLDQGVTNGGIATTTDDSGNLVPSYTISAPRVATIPVSQRANRISPDISFTATLAGAIQSVTVIGVVSF